MFQNNLGFQRGIQLIVSPKDDKRFVGLEIRTDTNPNDAKYYQLTDKEIVELRDLLTTFINAEKQSWTSRLDIQEAHVVE